MRLAVFASGHGSNLAAIAQELPVSLVFSDDPQSRALTLVPEAQNVSFSPGQFASRVEYEEALAALVKEHSIDLVALAGYMRIIGKPLLATLPGRIVNIHPSLLPHFPGKDSIRRAYDAGVDQTGVTVHFVDEGVDTGPVIIQEAVSTKGTLNELEERVHEVEHRLYPKVLKQLMEEDS